MIFSMLCTDLAAEKAPGIWPEEVVREGRYYSFLPSLFSAASAVFTGFVFLQEEFCRKVYFCEPNE